MLLLAAVVAAFLDKARDVQGRAELGAFQYTLGTLRASLAVEQVRLATAGSPLSATPNPFNLLSRRPANYAGEMAMTDAQSGALAGGYWFYDNQCPCIGYRPAHDRRFMAASGGKLMIFGLLPDRVMASIGAAGVLVAREPYLWWGEAVQ